MEEKLCCKCHKAPVVRKGRCAECYRLYYREYYAAHREQLSTRAREARKRRLAAMSEEELTAYRKEHNERTKRYKRLHPDYAAKQLEYTRRYLRKHRESFSAYFRRRYRAKHPYAGMTKAALWEQNERMKTTLELLKVALLPSGASKMINETLEALEAGKED